MKAFFLFIVVIAGAYVDAEEVLPDALSAKFDSVEGVFNQSKKLVGLPNPLKSSGYFKFYSGRQLSWYVTDPVQSQIEIYPDRILQFAGQTLVAELAADKYPFVQGLREIFFSILESDKVSLSNHFDISASKDGSAWREHLVPKQQFLGQVIEWIELVGGEQLERVIIRERNGDQLCIEFHQLLYR